MHSPYRQRETHSTSNNYGLNVDRDAVMRIDLWIVMSSIIIIDRKDGLYDVDNSLASITVRIVYDYIVYFSVLYKDGPDYYHSTFGIRIIQNDDDDYHSSMIYISALNRQLSAVRKVGRSLSILNNTTVCNSFVFIIDDYFMSFNHFMNVVCVWLLPRIYFSHHYLSFLPHSFMFNCLTRRESFLCIKKEAREIDSSQTSLCDEMRMFCRQLIICKDHVYMLTLICIIYFCTHIKYVVYGTLSE